MEQDSPRPATSAKKAIGILVLLLAIIAIITSGIPMLSRGFVDNALKRFAEYLDARTHGQARFTYDNVGMEGLAFGFGTRAVVQNPAITLARGPLAGGNAVTMSTNRVRIVPQSNLNGGIDIDFPDPLHFSENGAHTSTVTFDGMPRYSFLQKKQGKQWEQWHALMLPSKFTIQPETAEGKPATDKPKIIVTYNANPVINAHVFPDQDTTSTEMHMQNLAVTEEGGKASVTVGSLDISTRRAPEAGNKLGYSVTLGMQDIGYMSGGVLQGPYHFKIDFGGSHVIPQPGQPVREANVTVRSMALGSEKFEITASGAFSATPDDILPYGKFDVAIKNFAALRDSPVLSPEARAALVGAMSKITGTDAATATDVNFAIQRQKQGTLMVGNATFEEVAGILFTRAVLGAQPPQAAPANPTQPGQAPATSAPGTAPATPAPAVTAPAIPAPASPATASPPVPAAPAPAVPAQR